MLAKKTRKRRSSDDSDEEDDEELDVLLSDSTPEPEGQQGPEALECESKLRVRCTVLWGCQECLRTAAWHACVTSQAWRGIEACTCLLVWMRMSALET